MYRPDDSVKRFTFLCHVQANERSSRLSYPLSYLSRDLEAFYHDMKKVFIQVLAEPEVWLACMYACRANLVYNLGYT